MCQSSDEDTSFNAAMEEMELVKEIMTCEGEHLALQNDLFTSVQ